MDRHRLKTWAAVVFVLTTVFGGAGAYGHWAFYNVPAFQFRPVCNDHDRTKRDYHFLHLVEGEPTNEFWELVVDYYYPNGRYDRYDGGAVKNGKMYVSADFFFPLDNMVTKFSGEFTEEGYFSTREAAYEIYQRRIADGSINEETLAPFRTFYLPKRQPTEKKEHLRYDECGFVEELIIKGGRFAGE